jgi:hypothetical protein
MYLGAWRQQHEAAAMACAIYLMACAIYLMACAIYRIYITHHIMQHVLPYIPQGGEVLQALP